MSRKIEIELTSIRPDGTWTWRVAGAKQPRGVLEGSLLPADTKVGDVLRAEAEFELDGTVITSVLAAPPKRVEPERLEIIGDRRPFEAVTTSLVPKTGRPRRDPFAIREDRGSGRGGAPSGPRSPRPTGRGDRPPASTTGQPPAARSDRPGRPDQAGRPDRPARPDHAGAPGRTGPREGAVRPGSRPGRDQATTGARAAAGPGRDAGVARRGSPGEGPRDGRATTPPRPKRLNPLSTHRNAVLDTLPPEERPVADQLLQGGIPAVRRALQEQNARAREQGRPEIKADALLGLAEELLPRLKAAEWRDRAEAAAKDIGEINLRDLRSIVAGGDAGARDDESRILAKTLREALDQREVVAREAWVAEITTCLDEGRVTRALRVAGRPPDPRTRFPADLMTRLAESASAAMAADTPPDRWAALLAAVLESPVRRSVKPAGLPEPAGEALLAAARQASGRIPALATILGLNMPPPPGPPRPGMRPPRPVPRPPARGPRPTPQATTGTTAAPAAPAEPAAPSGVPATGESSLASTDAPGAPVATPSTEAPQYAAAPDTVPTGTAATETAATETAVTETAVTETAVTETAATETAATETSPVPDGPGPDRLPVALDEPDASPSAEPEVPIGLQDGPGFTDTPGSGSAAVEPAHDGSAIQATAADAPPEVDLATSPAEESDPLDLSLANAKPSEA